MSENFVMLYLRLLDPPKSPFLRGARGDQAKYLILLRHPSSHGHLKQLNMPYPETL